MLAKDKYPFTQKIKIPMLLRFFLCCLPFYCIACNTPSPQTDTLPIRTDTIHFPYTKLDTQLPKIFPTFDRDDLQRRLQEKIAAGEPLLVHAFVPLCDNDNQGIVPVGAALGNGLNLQTNLYWGARYGIKSHFARQAAWQQIAGLKDPSETILERVVFYRSYPNGAKVYLVADAYRGDQMQACLLDYLDALAGKRQDTVAVQEQQFAIAGAADLLVFNGHNGLMDYYDTPTVENADGRKREASVIGCISHRYFVDYLRQAQAYPLLMTTNLMAPEAYVAEALIDAWAQGRSGEEVRQSAGRAYHEYQQCGLKGATRLFQTGW